MIQFILKRFFYSLLILWGVITIVFFLFNILPGDPARMMLGQRENSEQLQKIKMKYGFNLPIFTQYIFYLNDLSPISIHKNSSIYTSIEKYKAFNLLSIKEYKIALKFPYLRSSFVKVNKTVISIIKETLSNTIILAASSIIVSVIIGVFIGFLCAVWKNSLFDKFSLVFAVFGMSIPSFFSSILVAWIFGYLLSDLTGLNMTGSLYEIDDYGTGEYLSVKNLFLPALTLAIRPLAVIIQLTRSSVLDTLSKDYVRTAIAKGLSFKKTLSKHVLKNSINPVITAISGWFASLLSGAVFVEYIFGWNGIGKEVVDSLNNMDLPVVMGCVLTIAVFFVIINTLVDIIYSFIDPRIRI